MALSAKSRAALILAATVFGVLVTTNLGAWQLRRAAQKIALQNALVSQATLPVLSNADLATTPVAAAAEHYRRVRLRGHWVAGRNVFLENRQMDTRVGFYLVTPLQLEGRPDVVLVQRGWVPRDLRDRTVLPNIVTPAGAVAITGSIAPPPGRLYEFAPSTTGLIRQNLDMKEFGVESGLELLPLSIQQDDAAETVGDGLLRHWPRPAVDVQKHYGYAFQWFAMGALMAGLYVWFQLVHPRLKRLAIT